MKWWVGAFALALACGPAEHEVAESESAVGDSESESGASESESESGDPESESGDSESESGDSESESESEPQPQPPAECSTARDCTLLTDSCGNPHGAPNGSPPLPTRGRICPANDDPPRQPVCRHDQCQTEEAPYPEMRTCEADGDCTTARTACGSPMAVNRTMKATFEREQQAMAERVRCRQPDPWPSNLGTTCLLQLCVLR